MKTFKQYFTEEMSYDITAGWITPKGKVIKVPAHQHDEFVRKNKKLFGISDKEINPSVMPKKLAIVKGAIRFHLFKTGLNALATISSKASTYGKFKSVIEDLLMKNRIKNYDLYLTKDNGELSGVKQMSLFESVTYCKKKNIIMK